jgi:hypothetical protein
MQLPAHPAGMPRSSRRLAGERDDVRSPEDVCAPHANRRELEMSDELAHSVRRYAENLSCLGGTDQLAGGHAEAR